VGGPRSTYHCDWPRNSWVLSLRRQASAAGAGMAAAQQARGYVGSRSHRRRVCLAATAGAGRMVFVERSVGSLRSRMDLSFPRGTRAHHHASSATSAPTPPLARAPPLTPPGCSSTPQDCESVDWHGNDLDGSVSMGEGGAALGPTGGNVAMGARSDACAPRPWPVPPQLEAREEGTVAPLARSCVGELSEAGACNCLLNGESRTLIAFAHPPQVSAAASDAEPLVQPYAEESRLPQLQALEKETPALLAPSSAGEHSQARAC